MAKAGRAADALGAFLRVLDADETRPETALGQKRLVIADIGSLGRDHPPAMAELRARRDRIGQRLLEGEANRTEPGLLVAMNDQLGETEESLELCRRLGESDPDGVLTRLLRERTAYSLVAVGRYDDAAGLIDALEAIKVARTQLDEDLAQPIPVGQSPDTMHRFRREKFVESAAPLYELLVGAGRTGQAGEAAGIILAVANDADTHALLASAGLRTMKPTDAHVEQARRALELAPPGDAEKIELLAMILQTLHRSDEARQVVASHIDRVSDPEAKRSLQRLVELTP
jgi:tetratricopeptide (TPR) repeat protein